MGDDEWGTQALGNYPLSERSKEIADALALEMAKVTTGSSLDMQPCDLQIIEENGGCLKEMEAAAVAFVCSLMNVPCLLVKSVTDLVDGGVDTFEEFSRNLHKASHELNNCRLFSEQITLKQEYQLAGSQYQGSLLIAHSSSLIVVLASSQR